MNTSQPEKRIKLNIIKNIDKNTNRSVLTSNTKINNDNIKNINNNSNNNNNNSSNTSNNVNQNNRNNSPNTKHPIIIPILKTSAQRKPIPILNNRNNNTVIKTPNNDTPPNTIKKEENKSPSIDFDLLEDDDLIDFDLGDDIKNIESITIPNTTNTEAITTTTATNISPAHNPETTNVNITATDTINTILNITTDEETTNTSNQLNCDIQRSSSSCTSNDTSAALPAITTILQNNNNSQSIIQTQNHPTQPIFSPTPPTHATTNQFNPAFLTLPPFSHLISSTDNNSLSNFFNRPKLNTPATTDEANSSTINNFNSNLATLFNDHDQQIIQTQTHLIPMLPERVTTTTTTNTTTTTTTTSATNESTPIHPTIEDVQSNHSTSTFDNKSIINNNDKSNITFVDSSQPAELNIPINNTSLSTTTTAKHPEPTFTVHEKEVYKRKVIATENEVACDICFDYYHQSGEHRACTLKCGHIFGKSCIQKWLSTTKWCPNCKTKSHVRDILPIYLPKGICELSPTEDAIKVRKLLASKDKDIQTLRKKISSLKQKLEQKEQQYNVLYHSRNSPAFTSNRNNNNNNLKNTITPPQQLQSHQSVQVQQFNPQTQPISPNPLEPISITVDSDFNFQPISYVNLKGSYVFDFSGKNGVVVASINQNGNNYGLVKISSLDSSKSDYINNVHKNCIKDLKISYLNSNIVCSVSHDKTVKLFNINNKNLICTYQLDSPGCACEFDQQNENIFYASSQKSVFVFDLRNTLEPILKTPSNNPPLRLLSVSQSSFSSPLSNSGGGIFVSHNNLSYWEKNNLHDTGISSFNCHKVALEGQCVNVCFDPVSQYYMASFKTTPSYQKSSHVIFKHLGRNDIEEIRTIFTDTEQLSLSRSTIFSSARNQQCYIATCNEIRKEVHIWNTKTGNRVQSLRNNSEWPPLDLLHLNYHDEEYLLSLNSQSLYIYKNV